MRDTFNHVKIFIGFCIFFALACPAVAQNTGGILPPGFGPDHKSAQYRIAINTETDRFAQRLHYQRSIDDRLLWRVVVQTRETTDSDFYFDYLQGELFSELGDRQAKWRKGLRFDGRVRGDDRPGQIGVNFANQ